MATFYLAHNVSHRILPLIQVAGHGAITSRAMLMERAGDDEQLFLARQNGWITVTHNRDDFLLIQDTLRRWGTEWHVTDLHAGILAIPDGMPIREQASILDIFIASEWTVANTFYEWRSAGSWIRR